MRLTLHPDIRLQKTTIGDEKAPLMVVDQFTSGAEQLVTATAGMQLSTTTRFFPGIRAAAPHQYQELIIDVLQRELIDFFEIEGSSLTFSMCHYSLVTTPPESLVPMQRIPHIDSVSDNGLATIHYLFDGNHGGTAFYRHRRTGYEYVDESRMDTYFGILKEELNGAEAPGAEYINGDTALFEQVSAIDGVFNRMLIYKRNSLHSGSIGRDFVPDPDPCRGRLSINCFIDAR
jgi:hypothetical protein